MIPEDFPVAEEPVPAVRRLRIHRAVARITPDAIALRPSRAGLLGPLLQGALAVGAVWLLAVSIDRLALWALAALLLVAMILGPIAVLGFVYNVAGSSFLMERRSQTARWQQGFLGLGIGTRELVPFSRIRRIEVTSDADVRLSGGDRQDVIRWVVELVKDNDRRIEIGSVMAARPLAGEGARRANALAAAVARLAQVEAVLASEPAVEGPTAAAGQAGPRRRYRRLGGGE